MDKNKDPVRKQRRRNRSFFSIFCSKKYEFDYILVAIKKTSEGQILRSGKSGSRNYWPLAFSGPPAKRLNYIMLGNVNFSAWYQDYVGTFIAWNSQVLRIQKCIETLKLWFQKLFVLQRMKCNYTFSNILKIARHTAYYSIVWNGYATNCMVTRTVLLVTPINLT